MNCIELREIELGKPDAKDEVLYADSLGQFCERIILPPNFQINNLINKDKCYIVGNKGVGKTALLFYINNLLLNENPNSVCSMILFKSDISVTRRASMDKFEKFRINNMQIDEDELKYVRDFSKLWTLVIYKKVIQDDEKDDIFEKNTNFESFKKLINQLDENQTEVLEFTKRIPEENVHFDSGQNSYIFRRVPYPKDEGDDALDKFYNSLELADRLFCSLVVKKHKYYICIDELEAYNCNRDTYVRDLTMIRDLIITTKRINALMKANGIRNVKIILSVRTEMVNSIMRELPGLEYNKDLGGFAEKINWTAPLVGFIYHPLTSIWLKRIEESYNRNHFICSLKEIYIHTFPEIIGIDDTIKYVIERTWYKPRDIIRMMTCLHEKIKPNESYYDPKYFVQAMTEYSRQSKEELVEELGAIYTNEEIEKIFLCLTAYKKHFRRGELRERLMNRVIFSYSHLDADKIINDLYRIGIIGLKNFSTKDELWGFLGQPNIEDEEWRFIIHRGLWRELRLDSEAYEGIPYIDIIGSPKECIVKGRDKNYLKLSFVHRKKILRGIIHVKDITGDYIDIEKIIGNSITAIVSGYDINRRVWEFTGMYKKG